MAKSPDKTADEKRRDEVLKRMLNTPPKPHKREVAKEEKPKKKTNK